MSDLFRASMNETDHESLRAGMTQADQFEEGIARFVLTHHLVLYYSSPEDRRAEVARALEDAVARNADVVPAPGEPGVEWRRAWPAPARAAILALWRTQRR